MKLTAEYIAGLVDGEGCITAFYREGADLRKEITISISHVPVLEAVVEFFGFGRVRNKGGVPAYEVNATRDVIVFLSTLLPYLVVKDPQARLMLELCGFTSGDRGRHYTPEEHLHRMELADQIRALNGKQRKPRKDY